MPTYSSLWIVCVVVTTTSTYFELSPRLSLGEISGQKLAFGPVKDVLISTTWESNSANGYFDNFLYGVGFDLAIPYFQYANVNFYRANNEKTADDYQMTIAYACHLKYQLKISWSMVSLTGQVLHTTVRSVTQV
jgi:nucleoside-specific outer membrane channel protein Tsx